MHITIEYSVIKRGWVGIPLTGITSSYLLCLSQARTWISNVASRCLLVFNDFILALELIGTAIKNDTSINGMKINNSGYLLSQYADD